MLNIRCFLSCVQIFEHFLNTLRPHFCVALCHLAVGAKIALKRGKKNCKPLFRDLHFLCELFRSRIIKFYVIWLKNVVFRLFAHSFRPRPPFNPIFSFSLKTHNRVLSTVGIPTVDWFQNAWAARWVIVIALIWRWTGYNMVFYLAGLQNIDYSIYEAARIDGASPFQQFVHLTIPLLKPTILLTAIMSTSGTLQLFDESVNLTAGGPGKATMTLTHYIYNISFVETPKFNYAAALSVFILVVVAVLSAIQMKVGDKRD